jgi:hypothetical protein
VFKGEMKGMKNDDAATKAEKPADPPAAPEPKALPEAQPPAQARATESQPGSGSSSAK